MASQSKPTPTDYIQGFLFDDLDIRGACVRLDPVWQRMLAGRNYPGPAAQLFGEICVITLLIAAQMKKRGRLTVQLKGTGPVSRLVVDCNERLQLRGMITCAEHIPPGTARDLIGEGQLQLSVDFPATRRPYQSIVPLVGNSVAKIFEHYFKQSEQRETRLLLTASTKVAAGVFLQKMPACDERDPDGWQRIDTLAKTLKHKELLSLPIRPLLTRLFHEEKVRLFDAKTIEHNSHQNWENVRWVLRSLGKEEVYSVLERLGEIVVTDEMSNQEYRLGRQAIDDLFNEPPPTLH